MSNFDEQIYESEIDTAHLDELAKEYAQCALDEPYIEPYVYEEARQRATASKVVKICPQCGAQVFSDMDICYNCLYEFGRKPTNDLAWIEPNKMPEGQGPRAMRLKMGDSLVIEACGLTLNICASRAQA